MTDKEWTASTDIEQMIGCLVERRFPDAEPCDWKQGERKKRLFVRACLNRIWPLLPEEFKAVCDILDPEIDRQTSKEKREAMWAAAESCQINSIISYLLLVTMTSDSCAITPLAWLRRSVQMEARRIKNLDGNRNVENRRHSSETSSATPSYPSLSIPLG